jgi:hypothetical protein
MKSLWNESERRSIMERVGRIDATTVPRWGRMRAPEMVAHLVQAVRMANGELTVASRNLPLRYPPLKQLAIYVLPMPKGLPTAPELIARTPAEWGDEVGELRATLERFASRPRDEAWPDHPAFGPLSGSAWGVQQYRHIDHHLRQFGV